METETTSATSDLPVRAPAWYQKVCDSLQRFEESIAGLHEKYDNSLKAQQASFADLQEKYEYSLQQASEIIQKLTSTCDQLQSQLQGQQAQHAAQMQLLTRQIGDHLTNQEEQLTDIKLSLQDIKSQNATVESPRIVAPAEFAPAPSYPEPVIDTSVEKDTASALISDSTPTWLLRDMKPVFDPAKPNVSAKSYLGRVADFAKLASTDALLVFRAGLRSAAETWWLGLRPQPTKFEDVKSAFLLRFPEFQHRTWQQLVDDPGADVERAVRDFFNWVDDQQIADEKFADLVRDQFSTMIQRLSVKLNLPELSAAVTGWIIGDPPIAVAMLQSKTLAVYQRIRSMKQHPPSKQFSRQPQRSQEQHPQRSQEQQQQRSQEQQQRSQEQQQQHQSQPRRFDTPKQTDKRQAQVATRVSAV